MEDNQKDVETVKPNEAFTSESQVDLDTIKPIESQGVDRTKFDKQETTIANAEIMQVPSKFAGEVEKQWVLKVESGSLEKVEFDKDDGEKDSFDITASELFNLIQDDKGKLIGFPTAEASNLMKFVTDLGVKEPESEESLKTLIATLIGKKVLIKAYDKDVQGSKRTYLKFRY